MIKNVFPSLISKSFSDLEDLYCTGVEKEVAMAKTGYSTGTRLHLQQGW